MRLKTKWLATLACAVLAVALVGVVPTYPAFADSETVLIAAAGDDAKQASGSADLPTGVACTISSACGDRAKLDVPGASRDDGIATQVYEHNFTPAQRWVLYSAGDGQYEIVNANSGKALDVYAGQAREGARVQQFERNGTPAQRWKAVDAGNGYYRFVSALSDRYVLDLAGASTTNGNTVHLWSANGTPAQEWRVEPVAHPVEEGFYVVRNAQSKRVLDVAGGSYDNAGNVWQYDANDTPAQAWRVSYNIRSGYYTLQSAKSGRMLDVAGGSTENGANVWQYASNGTAAQLWSIAKNADGTLTMRSAKSGLAVDIAGGSKANGANVQLYRANGTAAQKFAFESSPIQKVSNRWDDLLATYAKNAQVNQLLFVKYEGGSDATVELYEKRNGSWERTLSCGGYVGIEGIGQASEDSTATPEGDFGITGAFGIQPNPGTNGLPYLQLTWSHYWCADWEYYNQLIDIDECPHWCTGEHLMAMGPCYDYCLSFDYNTNPARYGAGSAFFVHCNTSRHDTDGCITVSYGTMVRFVNAMGEGARICIFEA